jgi:hypothetical protein
MSAAENKSWWNVIGDIKAGSPFPRLGTPALKI